jgi:ubiquinol oxidase
MLRISSLFVVARTNKAQGNLDQNNDPNPYVTEYKDPNAPHPTKGIEHQRPTGWERQDVV